MYYQLTIQFAQDELNQAQALLEEAKKLGVNKFNEGLNVENFPWEQEKEITKAEENVKETEENVKKTETPEFTFEELRSACKDYSVHHGKEALKALFEQLGAHKLTEVSEDKQAELWTALNA